MKQFKYLIVGLFLFQSLFSKTILLENFEDLMEALNSCEEVRVVIKSIDEDDI